MYYRRTRFYIFLYIYRGRSVGFIGQLKTERKIENEDEKRRIKGTIPFAARVSRHLFGRDALERNRQTKRTWLLCCFSFLSFLLLLVVGSGRSLLVRLSIRMSFCLSGTLLFSVLC